jgi:hypothetical protein
LYSKDGEFNIRIPWYFNNNMIQFIHN